jgi:putative membrane protein
MEEERILIVCVDRDNDLGVKAGIRGPVIGREANLEAASKLALADPTEADANAIFGAVKVYDEARSIFPGSRIEIATITGDEGKELRADEEINRQMDEVARVFKPTSIVLVSDGADDELVIPILMKYAPIRSVRRVIVQQSREIEHTYILIKRYFEKLMRSPSSRSIVLGLPGAILILYGLFSLIEFQKYLYIGISILAGLFFLEKGFSLREVMKRWINYFGRHVGFSSLVIGLIGLFLTISLSYTRALSLASQGYPIELIVARLLQEASSFLALSLAIMFSGSSIERAAERRVDSLERLMVTGLVISFWISFYSIGQYLEGIIGLLSLMINLLGALIVALSSFILTLRLSEVLRGRGWK